MRPQVDVPESKQYECPSCGSRVESPEKRTCECGETLRALSNSRDL